MATKKKAKAKANTQAATRHVAPQPPATAEPPAEPLDIVVLCGRAEDIVEEHFGRRTEFHKRIAALTAKRLALAAEEAALRHELGPLVALGEVLDPAAVARRAATRFYDAGLAAECRKIRLKAKQHGYGKLVGTGARPWQELREKGASDGQIVKNLKSIAGYRWNEKAAHEYEISVGISGGRDPARTDLESNGLAWRPIKGSDEEILVVRGTAALVAEVRRVLGIPAPAGKPKATQPAKRKRPTAKQRDSKTVVRAQPRPAQKSNARPGGKTSAKQPARSKAAPAATPPKIEQASAKPQRKKQKPAPPAADENSDAAAVSDARVLALVAEFGAITSYALAPKLELNTPQLWPVLDRLVAEGKLDLKEGRYSVASGNAKSCGPPACASLDAVRRMGRCTSAEFGRALGLSTDAAGKRLKRMLTAGTIVREGHEYLPAPAAAGDDSAENGAAARPAAEDAALNEAFESSLRERGRQRREGALRAAANGWAKAEDVPDEETAARQSLANDEAWHEPTSGVVVDRRAARRSKGLVLAKPK